MNTIGIITCIGFALSTLCFAIALYFSKKENEELHGMLHKEIMEEIRIHQPRYEQRHEFVIIDKDAPNATYSQIKEVEKDGYKFDKGNSFPELLCFTKFVEIKDEEKSEK